MLLYQDLENILYIKRGFIMDKQMQQAIKQAKREYYREYRKKNADRIARHQANFWKRKAEELAKDKKSS